MHCERAGNEKIRESLEIVYLAQYNVKNIFALGRVTRIDRITDNCQNKAAGCNFYHMLQLVRFISHSINFSQPKIFVSVHKTPDSKQHCIANI